MFLILRASENMVFTKKSYILYLIWVFINHLVCITRNFVDNASA